MHNYPAGKKKKAVHCTTSTASYSAMGDSEIALQSEADTGKTAGLVSQGCKHPTKD